MDYFKISRKCLGENSRIPILKLGNAGEVFYEMALDMITRITAMNSKNQRCVFICPVGPVGQYHIFVRLINERKISLKNVWFINMDEYLTDDKKYIPIDDRLSFRGFMKKNVYDVLLPDLVMPPPQRIFPDPEHPEKIAELIEHLGGVDVCYGGIGITGHLAFNEPEDMPADVYKKLHTRVLEISPETRTINAVGDLNGAVAAMPKWCVTVGIAEILASRVLRLYCFRDWHRSVVRQAAYADVSATFPVTLAQNHPDARITITDNVAEQAY